MKPSALSQQTIAVLGLGESGLAMLRWCKQHGANLLALDSRAQPPALAAAQQLIGAQAVFAGSYPAELLQQVSVLAISPGIAPNDAFFAELLQGKTILRELDLFNHALQELRDTTGYSCKVVGVTGTNAKTTVVTLTGLLLNEGMDAVVAGNISPSMLDVLSQRLAASKLPEAWVLELSSFQLHGVKDFAPDVATVLNLSQDHLDWHGDMTAYANDKFNMFPANTLMLVNRDDALVAARSRPPCISFGLQPPQALGDFGVVRENGVDWLCMAEAADLPDYLSAAQQRKRQKQTNAQAEEFLVKRLMPCDALQIYGQHNVANAQAALALALAVASPKVTLARMLRKLGSYRGEPHRMQTVAHVQGVRFVDDSKGTNVGATVAALSGLTEPCWLIAGGRGKGQDFSPLIAPIQRSCKAVFCIGEDGETIAQLVQAANVKAVRCASLQEAVQQAASQASAGDLVLLSPACASLDMFKDYKHRAEVFVQAVQAWQAHTTAAEPVQALESSGVSHD